MSGSVTNGTRYATDKLYDASFRYQLCSVKPTALEMHSLKRTLFPDWVVLTLTMLMIIVMFVAVALLSEGS
jgi:hypothetical protein